MHKYVMESTTGCTDGRMVCIDVQGQAQRPHGNGFVDKPQNSSGEHQRLLSNIVEIRSSVFGPPGCRKNLSYPVCQADLVCKNHTAVQRRPCLLYLTRK